MKKLSLLILFALVVISVSAQDTTTRRTGKENKKEARRQKVNNLIRQAEEGVLVYQKQSIFGFQARSNGYGY